MRTEPTREENFAFNLVREVLGVEVDSTGEQRESGHVDAILTYPSGQEAALEVTILCDRREIQLWKLLKDSDNLRMLPGSKYWWDVSLPPQVRLKEFDLHWQDALQLKEAHDALHPDVILPREVIENSSALKWFETNGITVFAHSNTTTDPKYRRRHSGAVQVMPDGHGGAAGGADIVPIWLTEQAGSKGQIKGKVDKLARSGHVEQHLFLVVDISAEPFNFAWVVSDEEEVPTAAPQLGDVTNVWLVSTFGPTYLTWNGSDGWQRLRLPTN